MADGGDKAEAHEHEHLAETEIAVRLGPAGVEVSGGDARRVVDGTSVDLPRVVPVRASGIFHGDGWMGVKMRDASVVKGVGVLPMFAGLVGLLLLLGAFAATWVREGR